MFLMTLDIINTICSRSLIYFYTVSRYIDRDKTSWAYAMPLYGIILKQDQISITEGVDNAFI